MTETTSPQQPQRPERETTSPQQPEREATPAGGTPAGEGSRPAK